MGTQVVGGSSITLLTSDYRNGYRFPKFISIGL